METTEARATSYEVLERFLASYWTTRTRANDRFILTRWLDWCHEHGYDPVGGADAAALETFVAELKTAGYAPNAIVGRLSAVSAFYRWCVRELLVVRNPVEMIRRPARPTESATASLTRPPTHRLARRGRGSWRRLVGGRDAALAERSKDRIEWRDSAAILDGVQVAVTWEVP